MTAVSFDKKRQKAIDQADALGWKYVKQRAVKAEALAIGKLIDEFEHPDQAEIKLWVGPRGSVKTGKSYSSSACTFWRDRVPSPTQATEDRS